MSFDEQQTPKWKRYDKRTKTHGAEVGEGVDNDGEEEGNGTNWWD